jgi:hypothetical protein
MRIINKYSLYTKTKEISKYPNRILHFKQTKWLFLKKTILKKNFNKVTYNNNNFVKVSTGLWERMQNTHKNKVLTKRSLLLLFNLNRRALRKKNNHHKTLIKSISSYLELLYHIDYILFLNFFYPSVFAVKESIKQKKILINNKYQNSLNLLKQGDLIEVKDTQFLLLNMHQKFAFSKLFNTCHEVDYYSQSIIIIKDIADVTIEDFAISMGNHMDYTLIKRI